MPIQFTCEHCGVPFMRPGRNKKRGQPHRFCSRSCADLARTTPVSDRFWSKVDRSGGPDACWEWQANRHLQGYGQFGRAPEQTRSHRVAWELTHGPIPAGQWVLHHCDNPPCCNPAHLYLGTHQNNVRDRVARNRAPVKLTCDQVAEIRTRYAAGDVFYEELGQAYGVSKSHVHRIVRGQRRK